MQKLCVRLGGAERLRQVDFALPAGEVVAIIGANGAGKTTLLRAAAGEVRASAGTLTFDGRELQHWTLRERARHLAVLPQHNSLSFPYTVAEVVGLGRIPHSTGNRIDGEIVAAALAALDITHLQRRLYTQLSGGEKQRAQLARVMAQVWRAEDAGARLLILDEPTASLDLGHQQQLMQQVRQFAATGAAVLMVLHDLNLAARWADRLLAVHCGELVAEGKADEVLNESLLRQLFGAQVEVLSHPRDGRPLILL